MNSDTKLALPILHRITLDTAIIPVEFEMIIALLNKIFVIFIIVGQQIV